MNLSYFLKNISGENENIFRLYAIIEEKYYWKIEWSQQLLAHEAVINLLHAGMLSAEVQLQYADMRRIDAAELRNELGSFAHFVERAVNGFKSYLAWINPDLWDVEFPWRVPLK
jgi:hypothetical protein